MLNAFLSVTLPLVDTAQIAAGPVFPYTLECGGIPDILVQCVPSTHITQVQPAPLQPTVYFQETAAHVAPSETCKPASQRGATLLTLFCNCSGTEGKANHDASPAEVTVYRINKLKRSLLNPKPSVLRSEPPAEPAASHGEQVDYEIHLVDEHSGTRPPPLQPYHPPNDLSRDEAAFMYTEEQLRYTETGHRRRGNVDPSRPRKFIVYEENDDANDQEASTLHMQSEHVAAASERAQQSERVKVRFERNSGKDLETESRQHENGIDESQSFSRHETVHRHKTDRRAARQQRLHNECRTLHTSVDIPLRVTVPIKVQAGADIEVILPQRA